nr:DUF4283 domain-containing protein [Tanacetum cinerariifolium]
MNNVVMDDVVEGVNRGCNGSEGAKKESKDMDECLGTRDNNNGLSPVQIGIKDGRDVVLFDEELVEEGSKKWKLTLCGYFVGYKMTYMEL